MWKVNDGRVKRSAQSFSGPASLIPHESVVCVCVCLWRIFRDQNHFSVRACSGAHTVVHSAPLCGALSGILELQQFTHCPVSSLMEIWSITQTVKRQKKHSAIFLEDKKINKKSDGFLPRQDLDLLNDAVSHQSVMHRRGINYFLMWFITPVYFWNLISRSWLCAVIINNQSTLEAFSWLLAWLNNSRTVIN